MAFQEKGAGTQAIPAVICINRICVDVGKSCPKVTEVKEFFTPGDEHTPKARKPYTITKQRERWSKEEHNRFLEALKLYGRAWRQIEEHVGTKTSIQIRSHAQKFFSKVVRESSNDADCEKCIEIPPPRPKRKPIHPYPRKLVHLPTKGTSDAKLVKRSLSPSDASSVSEQETKSSTSVLSAVGSDIIDSTASNHPSTGSQSPVSPPVRSKQVLKMDDQLQERGNKENVFPNEDLTEVPTPRLRLFGRTVTVIDSHIPSCSGSDIPGRGKSLQHADIENHKESSDPNLHHSALAENTMQEYSSRNSSRNTWNPPSCGVSPWFYGMQWPQEESNSAEASMNLPLLAFYGNLPFQFPITCPYNVNSRDAPPDSCTEMSGDKGTNKKEGFCSASDTASVSEMGGLKNLPILNTLYCDKEKETVFQFKASKNSAFTSQRVAGSGNTGKGFVPYKRCLAERDMQQLHMAVNDRPEQRIRLCL